MTRTLKKRIDKITNLEKKISSYEALAFDYNVRVVDTLKLKKKTKKRLGEVKE